MQSSRISGGLLLASGLAVPAITYFVALELLAREASLGGPPNQGAMVRAGFWVVGAGLVGTLMFLAGLFILIRSLWAAPRDIKPRGKLDHE